MDDWLGVAVSDAGDMNGDGRSDLVVGASGTGTGRAFVMYGFPWRPHSRGS